MHEGKPTLQIILENEGWEFLGNRCRLESKIVEYVVNGGIVYITENYFRQANIRIREEYLAEGFKDVMVTQAYNEDCKPYQDYIAAVYVKRK